MKIFLTIIAIMSLVLMSFAVFGATSEEASASASVTVNTFVDITLTDTAGGGFIFGSLDPGTTNNKEAAQTDGNTSTTGAATITRETTSNVDVLIRLKGDDFTVGSDTLAVTNVDYDDDGGVDQGVDSGTYTQETLSTTYPSGAGTNDPWATLTSGSPTVKVWFWLDVPTAQAAGSYSSTFAFEGNSA